MHPPQVCRDDDISAWLQRFSKWLPDQGPLQVFVYHNPLHHFEDAPFHAVCSAAAKICGARSTMTEARYQALVKEGRIDPADIRPLPPVQPIDTIPQPQGSALLVSAVSNHLAVDVKELADAALLRVLPVFLDRGSASWPLPGREHGFLHAVRALASTSFGFTDVWLTTLPRTLGDEPALAVIERCLKARSPHPSGWPKILHEALFATPGYAGMMARDGALADYVAVRLAIEQCALEDVAQRLLGRLASLPTLAAAASKPVDEPALWSPELAAYQDAYEEHYIRSLLGALAATPLPLKSPESPEVQLISCIDDRFESLRRHIEETVPGIETFGFAGFFGVPIIHRAPLTKDEVFSCPAPVTPTRVVAEDLIEPAHELRRRAMFRFWEAVTGGAASRGLLGGLLASFVGLCLAPLTLLQVFFPGLFSKPVEHGEDTKLGLGFSFEERVNLTRDVLTNLSLTGRLAPTVIVMGHGSTSLNNPFISAYQCGACGGSRGGINARTFCAFANDPQVRAAVGISGDTTFIPAEYDTTLDRFRWFAVEPSEALRSRLDEACRRNAKERARKFFDIPLAITPQAAHARVAARASDMAEVRPEYDHATATACVVGPRALTRGLFLDRRSFLVSYDPAHDTPQGTVLQRMLGAPIPVSAGISLEYFFSTMDIERFGCGTKLPHNVQALVGVSNGAGGDLRPGLWTQTTEIHEPMRLVTVIYQEPELVASCIEKVAEVHRYARNDWIHMFAWSPSGRGFFRWRNDGFVPYQPDVCQLPTVRSSLAACADARGPVPPTRLQPPSVQS